MVRLHNHGSCISAQRYMTRVFHCLLRPFNVLQQRGRQLQRVLKHGATVSQSHIHSYTAMETSRSKTQWFLRPTVPRVSSALRTKNSNQHDTKRHSPCSKLLRPARPTSHWTLLNRPEPRNNMIHSRQPPTPPTFASHVTPAQARRSFQTQQYSPLPPRSFQRSPPHPPQPLRRRVALSQRYSLHRPRYHWTRWRNRRLPNRKTLTSCRSTRRTIRTPRRSYERYRNYERYRSYRRYPRSRHLARQGDEGMGGRGARLSSPRDSNSPPGDNMRHPSRYSSAPLKAWYGGRGGGKATLTIEGDACHS